MKIGVDAGCLGTTDPRLRVGVWQVVFNLLSELGKIDRQNDYWLYSFAPIPLPVLSRFGPKMKNLVVRPARGWNYFALPLSLICRRPDVFLGPSQSLPVFCPCPTVVIVHDLAFEIFPQFYPDSYQQLRRISRRAAQKASQMITVSRATKNDLVRFYQLAKKKISVVPEGYDSRVFRPSRLKKTANYFLFVGALKPVKNIPGLLAGFKYFLEKSARPYCLLLAGGDLWLDPKIRPTIRKLKLESQVKFLGHVSTGKLVRLYQDATAFVSLSFYEGFGLPFLEAMACGCPVIGSRAGSIPEVVGKAGLLVDPDDPVQLGQALLRFSRDSALVARFSRAGLVRARHFSWSRFAKVIKYWLWKVQFSENRRCSGKTPQ